MGKDLWTAMDYSQRYFDYESFYAFTGYFKAPVTGKYRFLMSCDDLCDFKISTGENRMDPLAATQILWRPSWTRYRDTDYLMLDPEGDG